MHKSGYKLIRLNCFDWLFWLFCSVFSSVELCGQGCKILQGNHEMGRLWFDKPEGNIKKTNQWQFQCCYRATLVGNLTCLSWMSVGLVFVIPVSFSLLYCPFPHFSLGHSRPHAQTGHTHFVYRLMLCRLTCAACLLWWNNNCSKTNNYRKVCHSEICHSLRLDDKSVFACFYIIFL